MIGKGAVLWAAVVNQSVLTMADDKVTAQERHVLTGHSGEVRSLDFSSLQRGEPLLLASAGVDGTARLWSPSTPLRGDSASVALWVQVLTGMELDAEGTVQVLSSASWQQRRKQLQGLGGRPGMDP